MRITIASSDDVAALADAWVELAAEQRSHDSHLLADANHDRIRESMAHHVVEDTCLVARPPTAESDAAGSSAGSSTRDLVGFVTFTVESGEYDLDVTRGHVENLFVHPDWRNRSIGRELLEAAECALADRGVDVVALEVLAANERAREFYERAGYGDHRRVLEKRVDVETDTRPNHGD